MFYQGPQINVILTDDEQKGTRIDAAHEKRKLIDPTRGIKKRASEMITLLADPVEKTASVDPLMDLVLDLAKIEQVALVKVGQGVVRGLGRVLLRPGKVAPAKPAALRPRATPSGVQQALRPPKRVKGEKLDIAVHPSGKLAPQEKRPAPKGYEFLEKKPRAKAGYEGEEVTKRLRTPIGEAVSKIPFIGKKLAPGVKTKMTPDEYRVMKSKAISGDIPRQLLYMGGRGAKAIGRGLQKAKEIPVVGAPFAAKRALEQMPLRERVEMAAIEKAKGKGVMTGIQAKRHKELQKKLKVKREVKPEVKGLPGALRGKRGQEYMEREAVPGQKEWSAFKGKDEAAQVKALAGSMGVTGKKGGRRPARLDEVKAAVKEYRATGEFKIPTKTRDIQVDVKGPLAEAFAASEPFRTGKAPEWFKKKQPVPESPQAVAKEQAAQEFMAGARKKGKASEMKDWEAKRKERLKQEAVGRPGVEGVAPVSRKAPGAKDTPEQQAARREEVARKAREFKGKKGAVPPVTPTAAAVGAAPQTIAELRGIAQAGKMHTVNVKTIRDIAGKEFAHDPKAAARVTQQFIEQRQVMGDAAKRKKAVGAGLDVAAGKPSVPAGAPEKPAAPPAADAQSKQIMDAAVASAEKAQSAHNVAQNMLANANDMPPGPGKEAALLRAQRFAQEVQNVPPKGAAAKVREYLSLNPQDISLTFDRPGGAGVSVMETGGPAATPFAQPQMQIIAGEGKAGSNARKSAEQWVKKVRKDIPGFDPTDMGQFQEAKSRFKIPANAEKAFVQVGQPPPGATTRTIVSGPEAGIPAVSEMAQKEMRAKAVAESMGFAPPTAQATGAPPPAGPLVPAPTGGASMMYRPETGGPPATPENMAAQQQRLVDLASGKQTPELRAMMQQAGVREPGMLAGAANIAPWILMPSLLEGMGFEGLLPQLLGYAAIPGIQSRLGSAMGQDPAKIQRVREAYAKGLTSVPAGGKAAALPAPAPAR